MRHETLVGDAVYLGMFHLRRAVGEWQACDFEACLTEAKAANRGFLVAMDNVRDGQAANEVVKLLSKCVDFQDNCQTLLGRGDVYTELDAFRLALAFAKAIQYRVVMFKGVGEAGWRVAAELPFAVEEFFYVDATDDDIDDVESWGRAE